MRTPKHVNDDYKHQNISFKEQPDKSPLWLWSTFSTDLSRCVQVFEDIDVSRCKRIWRGVRSDAQLSCTETRFQKCSQSGRNGSKHPMLSISMAYGIFWMPPGESSHPGGSKYVWQRGVEGVLGRVTGGRNWPYFTKKKQLKWAVEKNKYGHNFQNIASKTNQRGLIVSEPTLIQFGADILKIVAVFIFFYGS